MDKSILVFLIICDLLKSMHFGKVPNKEVITAAHAYYMAPDLTEQRWSRALRKHGFLLSLSVFHIVLLLCVKNLLLKSFLVTPKGAFKSVKPPLSRHGHIFLNLRTSFYGKVWKRENNGNGGRVSSFGVLTLFSFQGLVLMGN